ncbi:MAG: chorismate mutase [Firmicutes bacterium]|nr:chorismate mutase [Bacillota bacterium]
MGCSVVRGIRGAITVPENSKAEILQATKELLHKMAVANNVQQQEIVSIIFSATPDLTACFPAAAARELGWTHVPLLDTVEMNVPGSLPLCIRVLMHVNTHMNQVEVKHIYLREASLLRPDLSLDNT